MRCLDAFRGALWLLTPGVRYEEDVNTAKLHLAKLRQRLVTDRVVIGLGFAFYLCVVLSIWYRRLF